MHTAEVRIQAAAEQAGDGDRQLEPALFQPAKHGSRRRTALDVEVPFLRHDVQPRCCRGIVDREPKVHGAPGLPPVHCVVGHRVGRSSTVACRTGGGAASKNRSLVGAAWSRIRAEHGLPIPWRRPEPPPPKGRPRPRRNTSRCRPGSRHELCSRAARKLARSSGRSSNVSRRELAAGFVKQQTGGSFDEGRFQESNGVQEARWCTEADHAFDTSEAGQAEQAETVGKPTPSQERVLSDSMIWTGADRRATHRKTPGPA